MAEAGSIRAFHALQRVGVDKGLLWARIQEGNIVELHGHGAAVDRPSFLNKQEDKALARRAREGADRGGRRAWQRERRRRGPMARL